MSILCSNESVSGTRTTHILKTIVDRYPKILTPGSSAAYAVSPDLLSKFDIVDQKVGFRPSRIGGVRVEVEHGRKLGYKDEEDEDKTTWNTGVD